MAFRAWIEAPNGQRYKGRYPSQIGTGGEGPYIASLAQHVRGLCEVVLPVGRADVAGGGAVFEVEPVRSWKTGARQALAYAGQTGWPPALALFGRADYLRIYLFLRDRIPHLTLWVWRGHWVQTTSRRAAVIRHAPLISPVPPPAGPSEWDLAAARATAIAARAPVGVWADRLDRGVA